MFKASEINGDVILDFDGAGVGLGDTLNFEGFGPGAVLSSIGNVWTISYGARPSEIFTMNVTALAPGDAILG
jgi:hypothetical protein